MTSTNTSPSGLRVAITGAGRGIGLATARAFHRQGATVIIGDLDLDVATEAAASIGPDVVAVALDVADHASFAAFLAAATADGPLDVLVNNAGIMPIGHFLDLSPETHRKAVEVNVVGCLNGMHLALPDMLARGRGHIVNVASTAGKTPVPGGLSYCGTKAAVIALTETARVEYAGSGVEFTCVMPHFTNTELIAGTTSTRLMPVVEPDDVAAAIVDAVRDPQPDVFVPKLIGPMLGTMPLLGRTLRDFLSRKLGAYDSFLDIDQSARAGYNRRIDGDPS
ncbi:SDR family oxidoreductase [Skermania piniformis]|uniref:SDR family oxidoreductase n=1 Tax=Skermania pinensis TaxID=39122 RepID=A0ABX8S6U3_9ACTN|nr:SDR family oxidoreductase [Skermania piniformis]QXQ13468.1 SDR family oxidoreductase [Skermania piniformis]